MNEVGNINTCCKNCVFAIYNESGKTQVSCKLGRIEKFGSDVLECMDADKEFYVVNRVCNAFRDVESQFAKDNKDNLCEAVLNEEKAKVAVIIYLDKGSTKEKLAATCKSLVGQKHLPFYVCVFDNKSSLKPSEIHSTIWSVFENKFSWRIGASADEVAKGKAIDIAVDMLPSKDNKPTGEYAMYYALFNAGFTIPDDFIFNISNLLNVEMKRFVFCSPIDTDNNGVICHILAHKEFGGNSSEWINDTDKINSIEEKLKAIAEANDTKDMILDAKCL